MALTDAENQRITTIEELLNKVQVAISNLASKQQLTSLLLIKQTEINSLTQRVATLEAEVQALQSKLD